MLRLSFFFASHVANENWNRAKTLFEARSPSGFPEWAQKMRKSATWKRVYLLPSFSSVGKLFFTKKGKILFIRPCQALGGVILVSLKRLPTCFFRKRLSYFCPPLFRNVTLFLLNSFCNRYAYLSYVRTCYFKQSRIC